MMGRQSVPQEPLFHGFDLERHVPADHLLRSIDRFVDLNGVREHLRPFHSATGRPSIDRELLLRMLLVGYCSGIRSERRLREEVHLNLAYRWFCRLGLDGGVPDHSTFSKNRHGRFRDSDILRKLFETVLSRCMAEGLVGGEGFAVDASMIVADAHRQRGAEDRRPCAEGEPGGRRISCHPGGCRLRDCDAGRAEVHFARRSGSALDCLLGWTCRSCLLHQLSHRRAACRDRRCRALDRRAAGRGNRRQNDDRARARSACALAGAPRGGYRLRLSGDAELVGPRTRDRTAHSGVRHIKAQGWHVFARGLPLRSRPMPISALLESRCGSDKGSIEPRPRWSIRTA